MAPPAQNPEQGRNFVLEGLNRCQSLDLLAQSLDVLGYTYFQFNGSDGKENPSEQYSAKVLAERVRAGNTKLADNNPRTAAEGLFILSKTPRATWKSGDTNLREIVHQLLKKKELAPFTNMTRVQFNALMDKKYPIGEKSDSQNEGAVRFDVESLGKRFAACTTFQDLEAILQDAHEHNFSFGGINAGDILEDLRNQRRTLQSRGGPTHRVAILRSVAALPSGYGLQVAASRVFETIS